jgi:hypothetical protein
VIADEARIRTQIFAAALALRALATRVAEPRNTDAIAGNEVGHTVTHLIDDADDFVTGDQRDLRVGQIAVDHMEIRPAHAACAHLDQQLARQRNRQLALDRLELVGALTGQHHGLH